MADAAAYLAIVGACSKVSTDEAAAGPSTFNFGTTKGNLEAYSHIHPSWFTIAKPPAGGRLLVWETGQLLPVNKGLVMQTKGSAVVAQFLGLVGSDYVTLALPFGPYTVET